MTYNGVPYIEVLRSFSCYCSREQHVHHVNLQITELQILNLYMPNLQTFEIKAATFK